MTDDAFGETGRLYNVQAEARRCHSASGQVVGPLILVPLLERHHLDLGPHQLHRWHVDYEERRHAMTGTIRTLRVDKGFGFIKDDKGKEYFFHRSAVYGEGLENLREGDSVEFDVGEGPKGPRAENVRRTST
jgi:CspA family cold shock protein